MLKQRKFVEAEASYRRALELAPNSASVHLALGNFYAYRNDTAKADAALAKASELAPPVSSIRVRYAAFIYATPLWPSPVDRLVREMNVSSRLKGAS